MNSPKRNIEAVYPLSPMQQGMLFHSLFDESGRAYFEQLCCTLTGSLDVAAFQRAWRQVVARNPVLRTSFAWKKVENMLQVVQREVDLPFEVQDWQSQTAPEQAQRLESYLQADRQKGFDLSRPPLMRLALLRSAVDRHIFVWSHHHILLDGWSMPLILREVIRYYEAYRQGSDLNLPPARPYREYIAWLQKQNQAQARSYWQQALQGISGPTYLPFDFPAMPNEPAHQNLEVETILSRETTSSLQTLARQERFTLSTLLQGAWAVVLGRYSSDAEVVFGATVAGRPAELEGVEQMVGLFINTLPVKAALDPQQPVVKWLAGLQDQLAEMRQYEHSPLVQIQEWCGMPRGLPMFESMLVFENYPVAASMREQKTSLRIEDFRSREQTNYPLTIVSAPAEALTIKISYDPGRFEAQTVKRLLGHLKTALESIAARPGGALGEVEIFGPGEREQLLRMNVQLEAFPLEQAVNRLFEAQARRVPEQTALVFDDQQMTYSELNRKANQLGRFLKACGVGPDMLIGVCLEPSPDMLVATLGVLKSGGAFVPLDPDYPAERLAGMLEDIDTPILLTQKHLIERLPAAQRDRLQIITLDSGWEQIAAQPDSNLPEAARPWNLAYAIFTSGSTGRPKCALVMQRGLVNFACNMIQMTQTSERDRVLQSASFSFDAAVGEMMTALLCGATLVLGRREVMTSISELRDLLIRQGVTAMHVTPSVLRVLDPGDFPALRSVASVAEKCPGEVVRAWAPGRIFLNGYGPTETTIGATALALEEMPERLSSVPIGKPFKNVRIYVLDDRGEPAPMGAPGEVYIGGAGVGRGYLKRPELTAEKFLPDPFAGPAAIDAYRARPGAVAGWEDAPRMYRTGDLARYRADGLLEFMGRIDQQVKLRGFRIELGEIENVVNRYPGVQESVVAHQADESGDQRLVAYLVLNEGAPWHPAGLRDFLKKHLPAYMLPGAFVALPKFPRLPNGKINRKALAAAGDERVSLGEGYQAPRTWVEEVLAEIWARVLNVGQVGVKDGFFELGGHSLVATQLTSRIREAFGVDLPVRALFETDNLEALAQQVETALRRVGGETSAPAVGRASEAAAGQLSFGQQRLWFLDQLSPGNLFYNIPGAVRLSGELNVTAFELSLNEIIRRHAVLRTTFKLVGDEPRQVVTPELRLALPVEDLSTWPEGERELQAFQRVVETARQPFDLEQGPLLRARLLQLAPQEYLFAFAVHHIVADGWSLTRLIQELSALYGAFQQGQTSPLPELAIQYGDYAAWQRTWLQGEALAGQLDYWKAQLSGHTPLLDLPVDHPRQALQTSRGASEHFRLPKALAASLHDLSRAEGATMFMTLLAGFQALLHRYTGQADICVGAPVANRGRAEIEPLIGFFVNTLVMRADFSGRPTFRELLRQVRETALGAYVHQDLPFEMLVDALQPERDLSHTPLFQAAFTLQSETGVSIQLPGVTLSPVDIDSGTAKFDITLALAERGGELTGTLEYNADLFERATILRLIGHLTTLLEAATADATRLVAELPLLTEAERQQMLVEWNQSFLPTPVNRCAHQLFEAQAELQPLATAVAGEGRRLSYGELDRRANQLAHYLRSLGVGPDMLVAISTERSPEMLVGILGIMKAGGAYLPLDPTYPTDRLAFMLRDSGAAVLITQQRMLEQVIAFHEEQRPETLKQILCLDVDWPTISLESSKKPVEAATPENLAYVIYTSGSTGLPKGAMLRHKGLCNLAEAQRQAFRIDKDSRILQFSPFSFDASVWETFMALANGAALILARQEVLASGSELPALLRSAAVSVVTLPPSVLAVLEPGELPELETIIAAGEACPRELVERWASGRRFFNAYGPTETTVCASMYRCYPGSPEDPPIGRPLANTRLYVLDANRQPAPVGVAGELYVSGPSLARGYLNRPETTAEKFIQAPEAISALNRPETGGLAGEYERLYRTGDLVRYRMDGNIVFLGRIDNQVKLRGFRIELGEIEAVLREQPGVQDAVVMAREDQPGEKRLVAYLQAADPQGLKAGELRARLREKLPEYMTPAAYVFIPAFPRSPSGKVERKLLPAPESRQGVETPFEAPRNPVEESLAHIAGELLAVERVGVNDNFFELGGHSLLATQFVTRIRAAFGVDLALRSLFEKPTVAQIAAQVAELSAALQAARLAEEQAQAEKARLSELLKKVSGLSEAELREMLAARQAGGVGQGGERKING